MEQPAFRIRPSCVSRYLAVPVVLFAVLSLTFQYLRISSGRDYLPGLALINMNAEQNLPALFSTLLLLSAALLLGLVAVLERRRHSRDAGKWFILALGFCLMALDETLSLHEKLIDPMRSLLGGEQLGIFYFAWVVPAIVLLVVLAVFFLPFLLRLPRRTASLFVLAGAIYVGGAVGVELIEGWWREGNGHRNMVYHGLITIEESMEMVGVIVFIHALFDYIGGNHGTLRITFESNESAGTRDD